MGPHPPLTRRWRCQRSLGLEGCRLRGGARDAATCAVRATQCLPPIAKSGATPECVTNGQVLAAVRPSTAPSPPRRWPLGAVAILMVSLLRSARNDHLATPPQHRHGQACRQSSTGAVGISPSGPPHRTTGGGAAPLRAAGSRWTRLLEPSIALLPLEGQ
ncbi:hypothetical protein VPH35_044852 [Triticum aestivum]